MKDEILRIEFINKSFKDTKILNDFKLNVFAGEILGLVGLSETGKTLISNILSGLEVIDSGTIYFEEKEVKISSKSTARKLGIFNIHNKLQLVPHLSVADNIFVVRDNSLKKMLLNKKAIYNQTKKILKVIKLDIPPETVIKDLTAAEQHLIELAKAIVEDAKLIVIDDIIESYTEKEINKLKEIMFAFKENGISFLFITNKTEVLQEFADRINVLRDGKSIKTLYKGDYKRELILNLMIGGKFIDRFERENVQIGDEVLKVRGLSTAFIRNISFRLFRREILGILDIEKKISGDFFKLFSGLIPDYSGSIYLEGEKIYLKNCHQIVNSGIGLIAQESIDKGLVLDMNLIDNLILPNMKKISNKFSCINNRVKDYIYDEFIKDSNLADPDEEANLGYFDIYTQQKTLYYKWLLFKPGVLICFNPTARADVVSKKIIFNFLERYVKNDISIIIISSDLNELSSICDRILVASKNRIKREFIKEEFDKINICDFY